MLRQHGWHRVVRYLVSVVGLSLLVLLAACARLASPNPVATSSEVSVQAASGVLAAPAAGATETVTPSTRMGPGQESPADYTPDVTFTLRTAIAEGKLTFVGVGGDIDGVVNPTLEVPVGAVVQITLVNGDGALHDIVVPDFGAASERIVGQGSSTTIVFRADKEGEFYYYCSVPGHRQAGMEGIIRVGAKVQAPETKGEIIARDPTDVPPPIGDRGPTTVRIDLEAVEVKGQLADGTTYTFWTFNGKVPGPFFRVRVGDTVEVHFRNSPNSTMPHSVDFHAVTGPGGGAVLTQTPPGEERVFTFKAMNPGLYVYHCATPMVAQHIANGMYGLILVEPEGGLPPVDREFYVMQGEIYTVEPYGTKGELSFSVEKLLREEPEYFVFNGAVGALTEQFPMHAKVGETVRIFFGVGGPNFVSSFHVIGEIFDRVYDQASLTAAPLTDVQTTLVAPGGAAMVEFRIDVPGRYILVDHALSRLERGLVGFLYAEGPEQPDIFKEGPATP